MKSLRLANAPVRTIRKPMNRDPVKSVESVGDIYNAILDPDFDLGNDFLERAFSQGSTGMVVDSAFDSIAQQMLLNSCAFFAHSVLPGPVYPPYNGRFLVGDHHLAWDELIYKHKRLCVLSARDHGKTYFFDFAYPIYQAIKNPNECGYIFSATQPQAEEILGRIKREIENNPKLQYLVPRKRSNWGSKKITLSNGHTIFARGFLSRVRGAHPVWIVVDDGLNDETAYSETVRIKQNDYFFNAISNMVVPEGQIIVVGTPFHLRDLYGELKHNEEYYYKEYPAESNPGKDDNVILWPDRYDEKRLATKSREIGTIRYAREFLVTPVSDEMSLFPSRLFMGDPVEQFNLTLGMPRSYWEDKGMERFIGVDFAMSSSVQADYTVIFVLALDSYGNRWVVDIFRDKGLPYQEQKSYINKSGRKYDPALMFLEANQMQRIFGDEMIRETDLPIKKFMTGVQKNSLEHGVPELRVLLENGKLRLPRGDQHSIEMTDMLIDELKAMTFLDGKIQTVAAHDDLVMALWIANQAVKAGGFSFSFGETQSVPASSSDSVSDKLKEKVCELTQPKEKEGFLNKDFLKDKVVATISRGKSIRWCTSDNYLEVRAVLSAYVDELFESNPNSAQCFIGMEEIKRLDSLFGNFE